MAAPFRLRIVTPEQQVVDQEVVSVEALAAEGWLGIWAHHAPMVTLLKPGLLKWRDTDGKEHTLAITGGILDVGENTARVLADGLSSPGPAGSRSAAKGEAEE